MPPPADPTNLVERVAAAVYARREREDIPWNNLSDDLKGWFRDDARAAIRVVVAECIRVRDLGVQHLEEIVAPIPTDNPSGSTGQNVTTTPNAPEAGSNGEREALAKVLRECSIDDEWNVADAIISAGFTRRAQHDGEMDDVGERLERAWKKAMRERDEALAKATTADESSLKLYSTVLALRAERDALAAKLAEAVRHKNQNAINGMAAAGEAIEFRGVLLSIGGMKPDGHEARGIVAMAARAVRDIDAKYSAALAGNGTGEGDGTGEK